MDVRFWGPSFWSTMEFVCFNYPAQPTEQQKTQTLQFFQSIARVLPCESCKTHFIELIKKYPPTLSNRDQLSRWIVDMHNHVNQRLGKPIMDYKTILAKYENLNASTCKSSECPMHVAQGSDNDKTCSNASRYIYIIGIPCLVLILLLVFLIYKKHHSE